MQLDGGLNPVQPRHRDVEHHHVGVELRSHSYEVQPCAHSADNLELAFQMADRLTKHCGMIIREQQACEFGAVVYHKGELCTETRNETTVKIDRGYWRATNRIAAAGLVKSLPMRLPLRRDDVMFDGVLHQLGTRLE